MASVYSTQFAAGTLTGPGSIVLYTVPVGMVAIVREVNWRATGAGSVAAPFIYLNPAPGQGPIAASTSVAAQVMESFSRRTVVNAGQHLTLLIGAGTLEYVVSGYLLTAAL